jgi:hypothetical protein
LRVCRAIDWSGRYWEHEPCEICERRSKLKAKLFHHWPDVRPWFWPIVARPGGKSPYPPGHGSIAQWQRLQDEATARWVEIEAALVEYDRLTRVEAAQAPRT